MIFEKQAFWFYLLYANISCNKHDKLNSTNGSNVVFVVFNVMTD